MVVNMQYLRVKNDKKLMNESFSKFKGIFEGQLFTLKEFEKLRKTFYNLLVEDVELIEISKKSVVDYFKDGERRAVWDVQLPF